MKKYNTYQMVILPTNSPVQTLGIGLKLGINNSIFLDGIMQHLYFLSDEPIKKGDWCYGMDGIGQWMGVILKNEPLPKKIIVTTDTSLIVETSSEVIASASGFKLTAPEYGSLPKPSQEWVKYFIEQYNQGNIITEVEVEYEGDYMSFKGKKLKTVFNEITKGKETFTGYGLDDKLVCKNQPISLLCNNQKLVINPNNTVNIKFPLEEDWNSIGLKYREWGGATNEDKVHWTTFVKFLKIQNYNPPTLKTK